MSLEPVQYIGILDGIAIIATTGHKVAMIAGHFLHEHKSAEWIAESYGLSLAQIHAALSYYYDHLDDFTHHDHSAQG